MILVKAIAILLTLIAFICAGGCNAANEPRPADFVVTNDVIGPPLVGFGAQLNPYLYCHPNWGEVNDQNVQDLEAKVIALHPQHVRIFCLLDWFTGQADVISKGDPRTKDSFVRTVQLAQRAGASVNLTLWYGFWQTPDASARKFADILRELIEDEHLTAIQYVTLGNEPNDHEDKISIVIYNQNYRALDRELRRVGLRDRIKIISGELDATNQQRWIANLGDNLADVSDGYSTHMYWDYWDSAKLLRRVSEVPELVQALPAERRRPLYITEFGVRGIHQRGQEPGHNADGTLITDTPTQATQIARLMLEAINRGYVATVEWDCYDASYDRLMHYGLIGDVDHGWPLRPAYFVLQLFTHTTQPGWRAMRVTGSREGCVVAATRDEDGATAVYILNHSSTDQTLRIKASAAGSSLFATQWSAAGLAPAQSIPCDRDGDARLTLPPKSLVALTTNRPSL